MTLLQKTGKKCFKSSYYSLIIILILFSLLDLGFSHLLKVDHPTNPIIGDKIEINKGILSPKDIIIANTYKPAYLNSPHPQIHLPEIKVLSIETLSAYSESSPIYIDNNTDFEDKANSSGWIGDGSLSSPYIIANLNITITSTSGYLIEILNTNVYFQIEKCLLIKGSRGIRLTNVSNGKISENQLSNYSYAGIELFRSLNINISSNTITSENGYQGIYSANTNNSVIYNNSVFEHEYQGIVFFRSYNNLFRKNWIYENGKEGVYVSTSVDNIFVDNWVFNNTLEGIQMSTSKNCSFSNNSCIGNGQAAIYLSFSNDSSFINNTLDAVTLRNSFSPKIFGNNIFGKIDLQDGGYANISDNWITSPGDWAIYLIRFGQNYLSNNYIFNSGGGIRFSNNCGNSTLFDLYITNCTGIGAGIYLTDSSNSTITNITVINSHSGFSLYYSRNCTIDQLYLHGLRESGCTIYSSSYSKITDVYIKNTSYVGFSLEESNSSYIDNITVINSSSYGFRASQSNNCTLSNMHVINTSGFSMNHARFNYIRNVNICNASNGLDLYGLNMSVFEQFNVDNSREYGVEIESSYNLQFYECESKNNQYHGIKVYNSGEVNFNSCSSYNNGNNGFEIGSCLNSIFYKNYVFNNSGRGMNIFNSISIEVIQSTIYDNNYGIRLDKSEHGIVRHSIIFRNAYSGLTLDKPYEEEYSGNNTITRNDFIANGFEQSESQIRCDITTDRVSYNFYDDHREPDDDSDGIIDIPYGIGENYELDETYYDNYPLSAPYNVATIHYVTQAIIIYPNSYNISDPYAIEPVQVSGTITVKWLQAIDSFNADLTYSLWIRLRSWETEENWTITADGITSNSYDWDTTSIYRGDYNFKVVASHISGINVSSRVQEIQINNAPPELTDFYSSPGFTILPILWFMGVIIGYCRHRNQAR